MSTLRVNNITDTSGGSSSLSVPGAAKAWVNFNGTGTVAIRAQLNVSSITDNGVGDYTVNFTNALADANYTVCCTQADGTTGGPIPYMLGFDPGGFGKTVSITTSGVRVYSNTYNGGAYDALYNYVAIFR